MTTTATPPSRIFNRRRRRSRRGSSSSGAAPDELPTPLLDDPSQLDVGDELRLAFEARVGLRVHAGSYGKRDLDLLPLVGLRGLD